MAKWYEIKAAAAGDGQQTPVVYLYDDIGYWGTTAKDLAEDLKELGPVSALTVRINSGGGEVFAGIAIHNLLKSHPATVTVKVDGIAGSIASVIAMAGDVVEMPANAMMMIHDPAWWAAGTADEMREAAEVLDQIKKSLVAAYRGKSKLDEAKIAELMAATTWMTAAEAKALGFCDVVTGEVDATAFTKVAPSRFGAVPAAVAAKLAPPPAPAAQPDPLVNAQPNGGTMSTAPGPGQQPPAPPPTDQTAATAPQIAELCQAAGFPELIAGLLKAPVTAAAVTTRLEEAKAILDAGTKLNKPVVARHLITAGVPLAQARVILVDGTAETDAQLVTNTTQPATDGKGPAIDYAGIYARMNGQKKG